MTLWRRFKRSSVVSAVDRAAANFKLINGEEAEEFRTAASAVERRPQLPQGCKAHDAHHCVGEALSVIPRVIPRLAKALGSVSQTGVSKRLRKHLKDILSERIKIYFDERNPMESIHKAYREACIAVWLSTLGSLPSRQRQKILIEYFLNGDWRGHEVQHWCGVNCCGSPANARAAMLKLLPWALYLEWGVRIAQHLWVGLDKGLSLIGRCQAPHGLWADTYKRLFAKEMKGEHIQDLESRLAEEGEESTELLAAAATISQAMEVGKTAASSWEWFATSCFAELSLFMLVYKVGSQVTHGVLDSMSQRVEAAEQAKAARGERRDFRPCALVRQDVVKAALREGGRLVQRSNQAIEFKPYLVAVGRGALTALLALSVIARLLGALFIRFTLEARAFPLKVFLFLLESWGLEEARPAHTRLALLRRLVRMFA
jgi:hypothetical protein